MTCHCAVYPCPAGVLLRREFAEPIGGGHTTIHEEVASGDKSSIRSHEEGREGCDFVRGAGTTGRRDGNHVPVAFAAWSSEFILRKRSHDDTGTDRVDPRPTLAPPERL